MNDPRIFYCICCEEYHLVHLRQENGLCEPCTEMIKRWEEPWEPSWGLIFLLGVLAAIIEAYAQTHGG